MFCDNVDKFAEKLKKKGFIPHIANCADEAKKIAIDIIGSNSVGFGGSATIDSLGIYESLKANGNDVYWHWRCEPAQRGEITRKAMNADCYICSTNAITAAGTLINIDGNGNRVASMIGGPKKTILIIGKNKFAENYEKGMERVKSVACVKNARRLKRDKLPCAITGKCANCASPERMCHITSIIEYPPMQAAEFHLILVDEEMGF